MTSTVADFLKRPKMKVTAYFYRQRPKSKLFGAMQKSRTDEIPKEKETTSTLAKETRHDPRLALLG